MKYYFTILFLFVIVCSQAQVLNNNGAAVNITSATEVIGGAVINKSGTITNSGALVLSSDLSNSSTINGNGTYDISGDWTNNGTFTPGTSTTLFSGNTAQAIGGTSITTFNNITSNNTCVACGVNLAQDVNLIGVLTINSRTFTTTGYAFTLNSNASGTASIDAITAAGADLIGDITMERYAPVSLNTNDWRFLGSAVSDATATIADWADDFATSGFVGSDDPGNSFVSILGYDETIFGDVDQGYTNVMDVTDPIVNGTGYWVYIGPSPVTFDITGESNKFDQPLPVSFTANFGTDDDGWNLVANPYPCAIDWDAVSDATHWTKTNMSDEIHVYNSSTGTYADYTTSMGGVNGGSRYIASQQAFLVKADGNGAPVLTARELVKASAQDPIFFKTDNSFNVSDYPMAFTDFPIPFNANTSPDVIKLTASGNGHKDEILLGFKQDATDNYDSKFDSWKLVNPNTDVQNFSSVITGNRDLSINALPPLTSNVIIPLRLKVPVTGTYTISRDSILMLSSSCLMLEDLANGSMIDMNSAMSYSFTISDTTYAPRFRLYVCSVSTGIVQDDSMFSEMKVVYENGEIYLHFNLAKATDANIDVYNLLGNRISTKSVANIQRSKIKLELEYSSQGIYVAVVDLNDTQISQKILISK